MCPWTDAKHKMAIESDTSVLHQQLKRRCRVTGGPDFGRAHSSEAKTSTRSDDAVVFTQSHRRTSSHYRNEALSFLAIIEGLGILFPERVNVLPKDLLPKGMFFVLCVFQGFVDRYYTSLPKLLLQVFQEVSSMLITCIPIPTGFFLPVRWDKPCN